MWRQCFEARTRLDMALKGMGKCCKTKSINLISTFYHSLVKGKTKFRSSLTSSKSAIRISISSSFLSFEFFFYSTDGEILLAYQVTCCKVVCCFYGQNSTKRNLKLDRILCPLSKSNCSTRYDFKSTFYYKVIKKQRGKITLFLKKCIHI